MGEGVLTELLCIVFEIFFLKAPKTLCFAVDFLMAGSAVPLHCFWLISDQYLVLLLSITGNKCTQTLFPYA